MNDKHKNEGNEEELNMTSSSTQKAKYPGYLKKKALTNKIWGGGWKESPFVIAGQCKSIE